jgi:NAD(P)-dependent dehydrogenase (short-subunit alcohol dehydrogenase family)
VPDGLLAGRTVILTGAAGGIGRHVARALANEGARVAATDIAADGLTEIDSALTEAFDAADSERFEAFHTRVHENLGAVDGLVSCAGFWQSRPFAEIDVAELELMLRANVTTAWVACRSVLPAMIERGAGSIVNFASTAGEYGSISPGSHYAAAKGAVIAMTKSLAREASPYGVRVNAISPGPTDTVALGAATPEQKAAAGARTLFNRLGRPEEIAASCVYLVSDMSSFMTGHVLGVNGGSRL